MKHKDSSIELRAIAKQYIEAMWKAEIYRDFDDLIKFRDGEKRQIPRTQDEINQIETQIEYYASLLLDELIERWNDVGIYSIFDISRDEQSNKIFLNICDKTFLRYKNKVGIYVKGQ